MSKELFCDAHEELVEEWRPVPGIVGYEVSSLGRVRSLARTVIRKNGSPLSVRGCVLKPRKHIISGYPMAQCGKGGKNFRYVHDLVLSAFHGPRPEGCTASHLNGDRGDNRPENLVWEPHQDNCLRKREHGTQVHGVQHYAAKLTPFAVKEIRALYAGKYGDATRLARRFGVSARTIKDAAVGVTWSHV